MKQDDYQSYSSLGIAFLIVLLEHNSNGTPPHAARTSLSIYKSTAVKSSDRNQLFLKKSRYEDQTNRVRQRFLDF
jgi:hypothetical protein